uniref:Agamous-like MADS-box protein AGL36 n=1 Tax=Nicotiana tabacum TaxID=4097 RepID=A0A1S4CQW8_TOBAC|nr:PREDICTED: agamous-like MADS-box protein AGL36 [Nicotiana tabacum]
MAVSAANPLLLDLSGTCSAGGTVPGATTFEHSQLQKKVHFVSSLKKIKIAMLVDECRRSVVLQERMETLFRKAEELSVLCGVEIGIVVFSPDQKNVEYEWPPRDKFKQLLMRFLDKPLVERLKKLTTNEMFLRKEMEKTKKK